MVTSTHFGMLLAKSESVIFSLHSNNNSSIPIVSLVCKLHHACRQVRWLGWKTLVKNLQQLTVGQFIALKLRCMLIVLKKDA